MNSLPFQVKLNATTGGDSRGYSFRSTDGIDSAETVKPEEVLLLKSTDLESTSAVLNVDSRIGAVGCVLGDEVSAGRLMMTESRARQSLVSEFNRRENGIGNAKVMLTSDLKDDLLRKYDVATYVPKTSDPDHLIRQKILEISEALRDSSQLYIASDKDTMSKFQGFLEEFGDVQERIKGDHRLLEVEDPESPRDSGFLQTKMVSQSMKGVKADFKVIEGFFSARQMNAVEMLGREVESDGEKKLLDLSSGFGGAGVFASLLEDVNPVFVDRNDYMKDLVSENCRENNVEDYDVYTEDGAENFDTASFDMILYRVMPGDDDKLVQDDLKNCRRILRSGGEILVCHERDSKVPSYLKILFDDVEVKRREVNYQVSVCVK
jgi:16S rRNA G1207 methylase RsmC